MTSEGVVAGLYDDLPADPSVTQLLACVARLGRRVSALVAHRRAADPTPDDPYRGLYVSDAEVATLLRRGIARVVQSEVAELEADDPAGGLGIDPEQLADELEADGHPVRLRRLSQAFGLDALDREILVVGLAPDLDPRFEKLYGYLHDDVTRKRPSIGLAIELTGRGFGDSEARARFASDGALVASGLVVVDEPDRPFLSRSLRVPDRVLSHLLGDDRPEALLARLELPAVVLDLPEVPVLAHAVKVGLRPLYVHDPGVGMGLAVATSALASAGKSAFVIDLGRLGPTDDPSTTMRLAVREAGLRGAGLVIGLSEDVLEQHLGAIQWIGDARWPVVLVGAHPWDPAWSVGAPLTVRASRAEPGVLEDLWRARLSAEGGSFVDLASVDIATTRQFRLRPDQVVRAAEAARTRAAAMQRPVDTEDLQVGARSQNSSRLERLARRLEPVVEWSDLVLPPDVLVQLRDLASRYSLRDVVYGGWRMGGKNNRRLGVTALFAGPSGVGKTMAAEALASALGIDLYTINLATVVDKYIGETEKNLERIFDAAAGVNGVVFFDEADALFGKRSEVQDARDRYANVEIAYLLQRMEVFEGVAVLATNLRTNIDEAFTRRLDALVDFPEPDEGYRRILWDRCLGRDVPRNDDLDLDFLARQFKLSGGNIRNIAIAGAFLAAERARMVGMAELITSTAREYRKLGRLCTESEFGPWFKVIAREEP